ncbi:hypothetical protein [Cellulomonas chitinilytica]|nr:hypothetical protein [Cellulomonas chitinilytica]
MAAPGFDVDFAELDAAGTSIQRVAETGSRQDACFAWGMNYGHDALAAAMRLFASDVDLAVEGHAARTNALAADLDNQVEQYRSSDETTSTGFDALAARLSAPAADPSARPTPFVGPNGGPSPLLVNANTAGH